MIFEHKKVLVIGTGISGVAAAELLLLQHAEIIFFEGNEKVDEAQLKDKLPANTSLFIGTIPNECAKEIKLVVLSPGVPVDLPLVKEFQEKEIPIWGEIELAYAFEKGKVLAITGTNGKTTTTALLGHIMKNCMEQVMVVGNIGIPYTSTVLQSTNESVTVAELSSFQLETIHEFKPVVSAILNVTPDHLNRHYTMENYVAAKEKIARNQTSTETCVLNFEDSYARDFAKRTTAHVVFFSSKQKLEDGLFYENEIIYFAKKGEINPLINTKEMKLLGIHNVENVMAAIAMAEQFGAPMTKILEAVRTFEAVEHRIEFVATKAGVDYYNDSKGTNPDAAIKGIQAMIKPTYLIGGGYDKESEYDEWILSFEGKVKKLILLGQTREKIAECARKNQFLDYVMVEDLEEAVAYCAKHATSGEAVLLSPACASWGMFPNYEVRGTMFKEMVHKL